jgi:hypothetical protein
MTQAKAHPHADRGNDLYETPAVATLALLRIERVPKLVWEPAAGRGAIVRVLEAAGRTVVATDIVTGDDFLTCERAHGVEAIVTNPPLRIAAQFAEHALKLVPYVALLLPWRFWEAGTGNSKASRARRVVLDADPPARAYCFANRLPMMHRDSWTGPRASSAMAFGWFVWDRRSIGPRTLVGRLTHCRAISHWRIRHGDRSTAGGSLDVHDLPAKGSLPMNYLDGSLRWRDPPIAPAAARSCWQSRSM